VWVWVYGGGRKTSQHARRPKYFQFTPRPQSVRLVLHWSEMTLAGRLQHASTGASPTPGAAYPLERIPCPVALFHGQSDYLADCAGLVRHLRSQYAASPPSAAFACLGGRREARV
jgi:hypothetical protein